ncbi:MCE family protein [Flavobacterium album]|uniref:MCE family protein n=1 Tax=Flavobacterium album TaxID=2175091 RepID=A0A2S1R1H8_9FLAO|nr:MlaD family protein [Flavobacterium album]AWH86391.1 MCE family protein [Flavobacterium album]
MTKEGLNTVRLGIFVIAGLVLLVAALFIIGNNGSLFGSSGELRVRFDNTYGLQKGNNVFFSGINAGTVKSVVLLDEATIEVTLLIDRDIMQYIPENSMASISTEGLMGNKSVNITPAPQQHAKVHNGDYLMPARKANIDDMLETLSKSNDNIAAVSLALKNTVSQIEGSSLLKMIDDPQLSRDMMASVRNLNGTMENARHITSQLDAVVLDVKNGQGAAGLLLSDKEFAGDIKNTVNNIQRASVQIESMAGELNEVALTLKAGLNSKGPLNAIMTDSIMSEKIKSSLDNIEKGTDNFNQDMEALKHNFLLRGYFRKLEKKRAKQKTEGQAKP